MRILFLSHRLPYAPNRGDRIRAYHLIRLFATRHEVHLVSLVHDADEVAQIGRMGAPLASVHGARVNRRARLIDAALALPGQTPLTHVLLHSRDMGAILQRLTTTSPPDVVVAYGTGMARYVFEPALVKVPCLLDMVDVDSEKWAALAAISTQPRRAIYRREARLLRRFEQAAVRRAFATTVVNERERLLLEAAVPRSDAVVMPNGIDVDAFHPKNSPAAAPRVVFCGVFDYGPNEAGALWLASHVWPRVRSAVPAAQLSIVGMRPSRAVRALSSDPSIEITGAVADVRPYLWGAAVSVVPLHLARGLQNKVLEAIAAGLPCVVTPEVLEGLPTNARAACQVASDPAPFADAVISLLREIPSRRRAMANRADLVDLTWEKQLGGMVDLVAGRLPQQPGAGVSNPSAYIPVH